jgi:DNA-directed RNA polymerase subunit RPC12/RpoP
VQTRKLELACPLCRSAEVFYSCTPNCCFNHVCGSCGATFEPLTHVRGGPIGGIAAPDPLPDASDPTVACGRCESTAVYMLDGEGLVCASCGSLLELEFTEVAGGN